MGRMFEELDRQVTPMGEISVRRRLDPIVGIDVYEVKLGEEHLMSNVFTAAEIALADLALAELDGDGLDVVVGGLGLGYTARAALADSRVRSVEVVEALPAVIAWQQRRILPDADQLVDDERCRLVEGDFFAIVADGRAFGPSGLDRYDAILTAPAAGTAPLGLESTGSPAFCTLWTYAGMPAVTLPIMRGENGLPLGVQLVGRRGDDARLLRTARWLVEFVESLDGDGRGQ